MIKKLSITCVYGIGFILTSCMTPPDPKKLPDFNPSVSSHYQMHFAVGDRFETLKPMFLVRSTDNTLWISPPESMSPSLDDYLASNGKTQYDVSQLLHPRTKIEVVAIKNTKMSGPIPYFTIDGDSTWVKAYFYTDRNDENTSRIHVEHIREYFKKL